MAWRAPFPRARATWARAVLLGLAMAAAATALRWAVNSFIGYSLPFITYFPFLLAASIWGGAWGGVVALVASALFAGRLFFHPDDPLRMWALGSFVIAGGFVIAAGALLAEAVRVSRDREQRLEATEAQLRTLVGELGHRGRNAISVLMAIVTQSIRRAGSLEEAEQIINARLEALGRAQGEVLKAEGGAASLPALLSRTLEPFDLTRFELECDGAAVVHPDAAAGVCLVIHELATNAVKYGALSAQGRVRVCCRAHGGKSHLEWREIGGPKVEPPQAHGFGHRLLRGALSPHGGSATRRFEPDGVVCEIEIPTADAPSRVAVHAKSELPPRSTAGSADVAAQ
ncbi:MULTISPECIES: sensor histidine kinase [unclassified Phenylobacterium]|uniref:sensor histidine kinase n=1 Tax=unclassified Phenylobacterium TaxID=2640670 RepID=UPI00083B0AFC|nr:MULTISPECIES: HWE histidine kinase domain-containing protein [unclassified Phenylobacterium]